MKMIKSILGVMLSNITTIMSGIVIGFLVPKMLSIQDYGYYKTFTLYISYLGVCSLGIVDGIVLKYGAFDFEQLDKKKFRAYFKTFVLIHSVFAVLFVLFGLTCTDKNNMVIAILLGFNLIAANLTGYFQQISQITQRFKEYSIRKVLQSILGILIVFILYWLSIKGTTISYIAYSICIIILSYLLDIWYIFTYRGLIFGNSDSICATIPDISNLIKQGFPLLFANLCSTLILSLDRQFVNVLFDTGKYAVYAFAYSMLSLVTVATSAISTVIYPFLKRMGGDDFKKQYDMILSIVIILVYAMVIVYFPLNIFVSWFLPKYTESITIFRIIIPGVAISSAITVIMHNYYKTLGRNIIYFRKSIIVLLVSGIMNYIAYIIGKSMIAISIASVITIVFWFIYVDRGLSAYCKSNLKKNILYILTMLGSFLGITCLPNVIVSCFLYAVVYLFVTYLFYKDYVTKIKSIIIAKRG